jgi:hypothetical protein
MMECAGTQRDGVDPRPEPCDFEQGAWTGIAGSTGKLLFERQRPPVRRVASRSQAQLARKQNVSNLGQI